MSSINPFSETADGDETDAELVASALTGDLDAVENLVRRHQAWLYNIAVRMVWQPSDAEDVTQEVLVKAVTKLSTFRQESSFRTWLYRIACNHVLNMQRRSAERDLQSFSQFADDLSRAPDLDLPDAKSVPVDLPVLVEEAKLGCLSAMLLGLDRRQRLAYTLVELLGASPKLAAEFMEVSGDNFRQILHRARKELYGFMAGTCGLANKQNPCRCANKTSGFIAAGHVDPNNIRFAPPAAPRLADVTPGCVEKLESKLDEAHRDQHRRTRFVSQADETGWILRFLNDPFVKQTLCLDGA